MRFTITRAGSGFEGSVSQAASALRRPVEFTPSGHFVAELPVDASAPGGAFGIALQESGGCLTLAAVDDVTNQLKVWSLH